MPKDIQTAPKADDCLLADLIVFKGAWVLNRKAKATGGCVSNKARETLNPSPNEFPKYLPNKKIGLIDVSWRIVFLLSLVFSHFSLFVVHSLFSIFNQRNAPPIWSLLARPRVRICRLCSLHLKCCTADQSPCGREPSSKSSWTSWMDLCPRRRTEPWECGKPNNCNKTSTMFLPELTSILSLHRIHCKPATLKKYLAYKSHLSTLAFFPIVMV